MGCAFPLPSLSADSITLGITRRLAHGLDSRFCAPWSRLPRAGLAPLSQPCSLRRDLRLNSRRWSLVGRDHDALVPNQTGAFDAKKVDLLKFAASDCCRCRPDGDPRL